MSQALAHVDHWVAAGLLLQRGAAPSVELLALARPWIEAALEIPPPLPPVGLVADLGRLLTRAPFDIARSEPIADPELYAALDAYEEHVLGRLAADFRLETARDALVRLDEGLRPAAIAVFVEQVLARMFEARGALEFDAPGPAAVRRVIHRHGLDLLELGHAALAEQEFAELRRELTASYRALARAARQCGALIGDVELYTLENHAALRSSALRLAMAQIAKAAQIIERSLPVRVRRSEASRGRTPTKVEDESAYPIGGYSSISTIGGIESLVSSELIYMSPADERAAGEVDLFDVRWAAGELLKYTRDESVHTRERRTICFALSPALDDARVKDPSVPFQRLIIGLGGLVAGVRKLCAWLDEAELHLQLLLIARELEPGRARQQPLRGDLELVRLLLREFIEAGVVELVELVELDDARAHAQAAAEIGASDLVWLLGEAEAPLGARARSLGPTRAPEFREHALSLASAHPQAWIETDRGVERRSVRAEGWDAWLRTFVELYQALV